MSYFLIGTFSKLDCPACRPVATVTKRENCHHGIKIKINLSFTRGSSAAGRGSSAGGASREGRRPEVSVSGAAEGPLPVPNT